MYHSYIWHMEWFYTSNRYLVCLSLPPKIAGKERNVIETSHLQGKSRSNVYLTFKIVNVFVEISSMQKNVVVLQPFQPLFLRHQVAIICQKGHCVPDYWMAYWQISKCVKTTQLDLCKICFNAKNIVLLQPFQQLILLHQVTLFGSPSIIYVLCLLSKLHINLKRNIGKCVDYKTSNWQHTNSKEWIFFLPCQFLPCHSQHEKSRCCSSL